MHEILNDHPAIAALDEAKAKAEVDANEAEQTLRAAWDEYRKASAKAARDGAPMPPAPGRDVGAVREELHARRHALAQLREQTIVDHAEEIRSLLEEREADLMGEAGPLVERLEAIASELGVLVQTARHVASAGSRYTAVRPIDSGTYALTNVDVGVLIVAAGKGWRFLTEPLTPAPSAQAAGQHHLMDAHVVHGHG